jgi:hypothetical protein
LNLRNPELAPGRFEKTRKNRRDGRPFIALN